MRSVFLVLIAALIPATVLASDPYYQPQIIIRQLSDPYCPRPVFNQVHSTGLIVTLPVGAYVVPCQGLQTIRFLDHGGYLSQTLTRYVTPHWSRRFVLTAVLNQGGYQYRQSQWVTLYANRTTRISFNFDGY